MKDAYRGDRPDSLTQINAPQGGDAASRRPPSPKTVVAPLAAGAERIRGGAACRGSGYGRGAGAPAATAGLIATL